MSVEKLLWFVYNQNNSGGYFIQNDVVCEYVLIQASSAAEANRIAEEITEPYSEFCQCCGERWSFWVDDSDGTEAPEIYGVPVYEMRREMFREQCLLHHYDGRIERVIFGEPAALAAPVKLLK